MWKKTKTVWLPSPTHLNQSVSHLTLSLRVCCHFWEPGYFREWHTEKVNDVFKSWKHTHTQITQHKSSCESESELWLSPQSREPPTAEQSGKKKKMTRLTGEIGEKSKCSWCSARLAYICDFKYDSSLPLLSSPSCFSTAPSCLTCLQLIIRLAFFLSHAAFLLLLLIFFSIFIFHISCSLSLCSSLMETDRDIEKENLGTIDVQLLLSKSASHLKRKWRSSRRQLEQSDCICLYIVHWTLFI